jgi:hypothetical protein
LKTGEAMEIGVVHAPDTDYADKVYPFLGHKGGEWRWHVERALKGSLDDLQTRFYVGSLEGNIICNIMTVEHNRTGILGHVFTRPDQRRKGACALVMAEQMEDFRRRGGGLLLLGTGYNSPPYWIYHSFGFRSVFEGSGFMRYATEDDFETRYFTSSPVHVVDVHWHDWPRINVLSSLHLPAVVRSVAFGLYGPTNFEHGFLLFKKGLEETKSRQGKLLESESGAIVGVAMVQPDERWRGSVYLLDLFFHPDFWGHTGDLLDALDLPEGKIQCYVDDRSPEKAAFLSGRGFQQEGVMKGQVRWGKDAVDVAIYSESLILRSV